MKSSLLIAVLSATLIAGASAGFAQERCDSPKYAPDVAVHFSDKGGEETRGDCT